MAKTYLIKVSDRESGRLLSTWTDATFDSFDWVLNGGLGELRIELARDVRQFGEGADVKVGNLIEINVHDKETSPEGVTVYSGYLYKYRQVIRGNQQKIEVFCLGHQARFGKRMLEDGNATTITYSSVNPAYMFTDVISKASDLLISTTSTSVDNAPDTATATFRANTVYEALVKIVELAGADFFWYTDANRIAYLRKIDTRRIDHKFTFGKHFTEFEVEKSIGDMTNEVFFIGGDVLGTPLYKKYTATSSQSTWGNYQKRLSDQRVTVSDTAEKFADFELNNNDHPSTVMRFKLADSNIAGEWGYDIETLKPGDLIAVENIVERKETLWDDFLWDVDYWDYSIEGSVAQPQIIRRITYSLGGVTLEIGNAIETIHTRIAEIARRVDTGQTENIPGTPS